jgi:integrase
VNGKQKWKSLRTDVFSVAKLRLSDFEREVRARGVVAAAEGAATGSSQTNVGHFITQFLERTKTNPSLAAATKARREVSVKALLKTWPGLPSLDARRLTPNECKQWAVKALREGTGFVAPNAKTVRKGMSPSAFNKCVEVLRAVFEIAREQGVAYLNPADSLTRATLNKKQLELPTREQFNAIVKSISDAGARQSKDCADMVRVLAYSGMRLSEATSLRWYHVDTAKNQIRVPGTKSDASYRVIPIFPPLAAVLAEIHKKRGLEARNTPVLGIRECKGALASACKAVGTKRITHHDLRHMFATRCIESGVDIPTMSRWLGHSDGGALAMRVYGHLAQEHSQKQAVKVRF